MKTIGTITLNFTSNLSKRELLEHFDDIGVQIGIVVLTNIEGETTELEIQDLEYKRIEKMEEF